MHRGPLWATGSPCDNERREDDARMIAKYAIHEGVVIVDFAVGNSHLQHRFAEHQEHKLVVAMISEFAVRACHQSLHAPISWHELPAPEARAALEQPEEVGAAHDQRGAVDRAGVRLEVSPIDKCDDERYREQPHDLTHDD
eukprot:5858326-Prymnesium_polylepis.1